MISPCFFARSAGRLLAVGVASLLWPYAAGATAYDWGSATTGGLWSTTTNWMPNGLPGSGDIANLINATADRTVTYDTGATATVGTINFTQSSAFTNTLDVVRSMSVTNAITLGASAGLAELKLSPTSTSTVSITVPSITINSGGRLVLGTFTQASNQFGVSQVNGNVALNGTGQLVLTDATATGASQRTISGTLTANGGTIAIGSNVLTPNESRLTVNGNFSATGTAITGAGNAYITMGGATNTIDSTTSLGSTVLITLQSGGNQTLTSDIKLGLLFFRGNSSATMIKTLTVNSTGQNIGGMQFANSGNGTVGLKLGSNLTTIAGAALPVMSGVGQTGFTPIFSIDTNAFTLDLSNTSGVWTPNLSGGAASVTWQLNNSGTAGTGGIKVNGYNFTATNVSVTVGAGAVLEANGGNSVANNLGGTGAINATSIFRYAGNATAATPSTLTSNRAVGQIEVGSGSSAGALSLAGSFTAAGAVTVKNLGSFDLSTQTLTASAGLAVDSGGTLRGGNTTTAGSVVGAVAISGTLAPGTMPAASGTTIGSVSVTGGLTFENGSTLALEIVSPSSFDQAVSDAITLNGTVNLSLTMGASYAHFETSTFTVLNNTGGSSIGGSSGLLTWGGPEGQLAEGEIFLVGSNAFQISYAGGAGGNDVVLTAVPEPGSLMALLGGAGALLGIRRRRR